MTNAVNLTLNGPPNIVLATAGNKCDLEENRKVSFLTLLKYSWSIYNNFTLVCI